MLITLVAKFLDLDSTILKILFFVFVALKPPVVFKKFKFLKSVLKLFESKLRNFWAW